MANDSASALQVEMVLLGGTTYTSGSVSSTYTNTAANRAAGQTVNIADSTSNTWQITGMQLEIGTAASDFLHVPHDVNLQRCQRYYYRINPNGTSGSIGAAAYYTSSAVFTMLEFPTSMRTNPSLESATGTNYYNVNRNSDNDEFNDFSLNTSNIDSAHLYTDSNVSSTAGHAGRTRFNSASGYVAFSAEL